MNAVINYFQYLEGKITQETISNIIVDEAENIYGPLDDDIIKMLRIDIEEKLLNIKDGSGWADIYYEEQENYGLTYWDF